MTRRQWMWLWIWLLLFFMIFCVWNKLQKLTDSVKTPTQPITTTTTPTPTAVAPQVVQTVTVEKEDINFKIIKDEESIKISGIFSSKEDLETLKSEYSKISNNVEEGLIVINENAQNSKIRELLSSLSGDFSKFKSGYLEYAAGKLTIDGIVDDKSVKQSIGDKALTAGDLLVDNKIIIDEPKVIAAPPKAEEKPSKEEIQAKLNDLLKIKKVEFVYAKASLTPSGKKTIDEVYNILNEYKDIALEVAGHTDSSGSKKRNKVLSQNRADAIKNYLVSKGIEENRLKAIGYGENRPLVKNDTSKNRQINRRVEFKILGE